MLSRKLNFFSLPLFWSHQYSCHPLTHVQSNSTFTFSRLICRCFHHFSGLPTTILTLFCFLSKPCLFHSPFFLQFPLLKFHCFLLFCECFFTGYVIHFHCLLQFQLQSSLQDVEDECLSFSNERDENSGGVPVSIDFLPWCVDSKLKLPSMYEPNDSRGLDIPVSKFNERKKFSMLFHFGT